MAAPHGQNASLYVGDLAPEVSEAMLYEVFKAVGPVLSIRVCREAITRRSLGYAYVNFQNPSDAERALETLNYCKVKDRPLRIMWSHRDPGLRKSGSGNVFVKNLHPEIDNQTLYDTFSQFGNILSCKVATNPQTGESRGYGFVHFESEDSAKAAVEKVNGMLLKNQKVYVGKFIRRQQRQAQNQAEFTNVYVKNIKSGIDVEGLNTFFSKYGEIKSSIVQKDRKDRPYAFINFDSHEAATKAVEENNEQFVPALCEEGQTLFVGRAQKKSERQEELRKKFAQLKTKRMTDLTGHNLYVKNLDDVVDDAQLRAAFEKFGEITSAKVMMDDAHDPPQSKGFGFVCFKDVEAAHKALNDMNGATLGTKPLYVNVAQRKEVRRATLEIQYAARLGRNPMQPPPAMGFPPMGYPPQPMFGAPPPPYGYPAAPRGAVGAKQWGAPLAQFPPMGQQQQVRRPPTASAATAGRGGMPPRGMPGMVPGGRMPGARPAPGRAGMVKTGQMPMPPVAMGAPMQAVLPGPSGQEPLTAAALAAMSPEQQKNTLGERLFAAINERHPEHAAKITGMLLEMDITEQLNLLESPELLAGKIGEAMDVLKAHETHTL